MIWLTGGKIEDMPKVLNLHYRRNVVDECLIDWVSVVLFVHLTRQFEMMHRCRDRMQIG